MEHVQVRDDTEGRVEWTVASTPRSTVLTSTPPAHVKGGCGRGRTGRSGRLTDAPGPRPLPRRADHQGPPRRRRPGTAAVHRTHARQRQRRHRIRSGPRRDRVPRADTGRPRTKPTRVLGDKAYSSRAIRHLPRRRGIAVTLPERRDQTANRRRRGRLGGRPPPSTRSSTATATWSNDASHASSSSARSRRDSTSLPTATVPASSWPR